MAAEKLDPRIEFAMTQLVYTSLKGAELVEKYVDAVSFRLADKKDMPRGADKNPVDIFYDTRSATVLLCADLCRDPGEMLAVVEAALELVDEQSAAPALPAAALLSSSRKGVTPPARPPAAPRGRKN